MNEPIIATQDPTPVITRDQASVTVGNHLLAVLEDIIKAHEAVLANEAKSDVEKGNARLIVESCKTFGGPLFHVVKRLSRPRILRPDRSIRIAR